jgi:putative copper export protein
MRTLVLEGGNTQVHVDLPYAARFSLRIHLLVSSILLLTLIPIGNNVRDMKQYFVWGNPDTYGNILIAQAACEAFFLFVSIFHLSRCGIFVLYFGVSSTVQGVLRLSMSFRNEMESHRDFAGDSIFYLVVGALTLILYAHYKFI